MNKSTIRKHRRLAELYDKQGGLCVYCKKKMWLRSRGEEGPWKDQATLEHVKPLSKGGSKGKRRNQKASCKECNQGRKTIPHILFWICTKVNLVEHLKVAWEKPDEIRRKSIKMKKRVKEKLKLLLLDPYGPAPFIYFAIVLLLIIIFNTDFK